MAVPLSKLTKEDAKPIMSRSGSKAPLNSDSIHKNDITVSIKKPVGKKNSKVKKVNRLVTEQDLKYEALLVQN